MSRTSKGPKKAAAIAAAVLAVVLIAGAGILVALAGNEDGGDDRAPEADEAASTPSGLFLNECRYSHSSSNDPIVHHGHPGESHLHDFFGSTVTDDDTTLADLQQAETLCQHHGDRSAYWAPALFRGETKIEPRGADTYYRAAPGVDPTEVEPFPPGFMAIAKSAQGREDPSYAIVGWGCGRNRTILSEAPECGDRKALTLHAIFPDCWDGAEVDSPDHVSHTAYSEDGTCPPTHPRHLLQLELVVRYDVWGPTDGLRLSSGEMETAHADFFNAWDEEKLGNELASCVAAGIVCGVPTPP